MDDVVDTILVLGVGRSGTSLVAGCLRTVGFCMGEDPHPLKHEWSPIVYAEGKVHPILTSDAINYMSKYQKWGWKAPRDVFHLDEILYMLRNPGIIVCNRDLNAIATSSLSREGLPFDIAYREAAFVYNFISEKLQDVSCPVLHISYDDMARNPKASLGRISDFSGVPLSAAVEQEAMSFINPPKTGGYRALRSAAPSSNDPPDNGFGLDEIRRDRADSEKRYAGQYTSMYVSKLGNILEDTELALLIADAASTGCGSKSDRDDSYQDIISSVKESLEKIKPQINAIAEKGLSSGDGMTFADYGNAKSLFMNVSSERGRMQVLLDRISKQSRSNNSKDPAAPARGSEAR